MPNAHAPTRFSDAYPDEFAEWSDIFEPENMTLQQRRMAAIIDDPAVMHAAKAVIGSILADESERWCPYRLNFDQVYRLKFDQA